jgi:hypothetical protein
MPNAIASDLQRQTLLLDQAVNAFAKRLTHLRVFATSFQNVPLQGTDEVVVPYYPLATGASTDWNPANGYVFDGTTNTQGKKITVNKRKYQPLDFESAEVRRQPALNIDRLVSQAAIKLADDVWNDVLSVITAANFGASISNVPASGLTSDDVAQWRGVANGLHWPEAGRSLVVGTDLDTALMKDPAVKTASAYGSADAIRNGLVERILGFEYHTAPSLPENGQGLIGFITAPSAVLVAFAPVEPTEDVMPRLSGYQLVTDRMTGLSLTYRRWGDADKDRTKAIIECSYGYAVGETAALRRITKPV